VDDAGRIIRKFEFTDYDPQRCLADFYLMGGARMWRRTIHDRAGYMSDEYPQAHDYDLILRFAIAGGRFVHVPEVLYSYRWHGPRRKDGQHSSNRERAGIEQSKAIAKRAREWLASL